MMKTLVAGLMAIAMTMGAQSASAAPFLGAVGYAGSWSLPNANGFDDNTDLTILNGSVLSATGSFAAAGMGLGNLLVHATPLTYRLAPVVPAGPLWTHVGSGVSFVLTSFAVSSVSDLELELTGSGFFAGAGFDDTSGSWSFRAQRANDQITTATYQANVTVDSTPPPPPVPEPTSLALLTVGLAGLGAARRRSRR